jgi:hypothetical protein
VLLLLLLLLYLLLYLLLLRLGLLPFSSCWHWHPPGWVLHLAAPAAPLASALPLFVVYALLLLFLAASFPSLLACGQLCLE